MGAAVDAVTFGTSAGSPTVAHTCTGTDLALYVLIAERYDTAITGVTYNGVALTQIHQDNHGNIETTNVFRLLNPPTGAHDVVITQTASHDLAYTIISLTGVHQTTPEGTIVGGTGTSGTPTHDITLETDDLGLDLVAWYKPGSESMTVGANQTQQSNQTIGTLGGAVSTETGNGTVTMSWTPSGSNWWNHVAIPVKAAASVTLDECLPDADVTTTGWTSTPLYSKINDGSDGTVIQATAS